MTDEGNQVYYYQLPQREVVPNVERTKYISLNTSGVSNKLLFRLEYDNDTKIDRGPLNYTLTFNNIIINKPVPFFFSFIRLITLIFICSLFYAIRYNTNVFNLKIEFKDKKQRIITLLLVLANLLFLLFIYKNKQQ